MDKSPIEIESEESFLLERSEELAGAIKEYFNWSPTDYDLLLRWVKELQSNLSRLKEIHDESNK